MIDPLSAHRTLAHGEQLARQARLRPDQIALSFGDTHLTYRQLDERVNRLARALQARGISKGDRVAVLMYNRSEVIESYFAVLELGAIVVPINFRLVAAEVEYILTDSGSKILIVDGPMSALAAELPPSVVEHIVVTGGDATQVSATVLDYESVLDPDGSPLGIAVADHDPAFIMYTSGTTGRPKGAVISHLNLAMNSLNSIIETNVQTEGEVWYSGLPLFHIGGLNGFLMYFMAGGRSIIAPSGNFDPVETLDTLEQEQVTGCYFVPTQWKDLCAVPDVHDRKLNLRRMAWGASVAPPSVLEAMASTFPGIPNINVFGQTEMSSATCVLRGEDAVRKMGSVGTPVVNVEARIVDENMNNVAVGEVGEIVYRGPTVMQGYWNKPEATAEAFRGGWFHSGDLVRQDDEGFIYVVDRAKDMIISGGENIYCAEVEAVIDAHPGVAEVAVVGAPHSKWVETPVAVIVPIDPDNPPTEEDVVEFCRARMASYKKPTSVVVVDSLPRTATGKVQKFRVRESLSAH